jgi:hypothetical protein
MEEQKRSLLVQHHTEKEIKETTGQATKKTTPHINQGKGATLTNIFGNFYSCIFAHTQWCGSLHPSGDILS